MDIKDLLKFIQKEETRLKDHYNNADDEKMILAITVKLNEEMGELCQEVLGKLKLHRKSKLDRYSSQTLKEEFADVLITTLILANKMGVDAAQALEEKVDKINERNKLDKNWWK